jgi:putative SOS response-associated peptidase YedK
VCGRYSLTKEPGDILADLAGDGLEVETTAAALQTLAPRYNVAPTQPVPVVRQETPDEPPRLAVVRWGLIPAWATDRRIGGRLINARYESADERDAFHDSFAHRRCLVLADGFYEWQRTGSGKGAGKVPHYLRRRDGRLFAFAGLWAVWRDPAAGPVESCTILTGPPNELVAPLHNRMPVILPGESYRSWLDPETEDPEALKRLLERPLPAAAMEAFAVGPAVNKADNDVPECVAPATADAAPAQPGLFD